MKKNYTLKKSVSILGLLLSGIIFLYSCVDPDDLDFNRIAEIQWNPDLAIPLVNSSLTTADLITKGDREGKIEIGTDKFCTLVYKGKLSSKGADELLSLPDQNIGQKNVIMPALAVAAFTVAPVGGTASFSGNQTLDFSSGTAKLDSVVFKGGTLSLVVKSTIQHDATVLVTIPGATKNGVPLALTANLNASNTPTPYENTLNVNLDGYSIDMTNGGAQTNKIGVTMAITLTKISNTNLPSTNDNVSITTQMQNLQWRRAYGDIGTTVISSGNSDSVLFAAFRNSLFTGHIVHADPKVKMDITNSFGIPVQVNFVSLKGNIPLSDPGGGDYPITGTGVTTPLAVNAPTLAQIGQSILSSRTLDKTNSNVRDVINLNPQYFISDLQFLANPNGTPAEHNFLLDTSKLEANIRCELPLFGKAQDFEITKEFGFDMGETDTSLVRSVTLRSIITNGFPLDVQVQIYFVDAGGNLVDSTATIASNTLPVRAGIIDATGKVIKSTTYIADNTMNKTRWQNIIKKATLIRIVADLESKPTSDDIKIFSDYKMDVQLSVRAQLEANLKTTK